MLAEIKTEMQSTRPADTVLMGIRDRALASIHLTPKEILIARLLLKGLSTQDMARILVNSEKTLKQHIGTIYHKAGVHSRHEFFYFVFPT